MFARSLSQYNWGRFFATINVEACWSILLSQIKLHCDFFAPFRTFFVHKKNPAWFSESILSSATRRDRLFKRAKSNKDNDLLNEARSLRNTVKNLVSNARSDYYINQLELSNRDPKRFWRTVDDITGKGSSPSITAVRDHVTGGLLNELDSAQSINEYFSQIGNKLDAALPAVPNPNSITPTDFTFRLLPDITVRQFVELVESLDISKHSGCVLIPSRLYRDAMLALPEQFVYLYNLSIRTNVIPSDWKAALVTPLPKKGDTTDPSNLRPISITHICGKLLEKIVNQRLMDYLEYNKLLFDYQMGF